MPFFGYLQKLIGEKNWMGIAVFCAISSVVTLYFSKDKQTSGRLEDSIECRDLLATNDAKWLDREDRLTKVWQDKFDALSLRYMNKDEKREEQMQQRLDAFYAQKKEEKVLRRSSRQKTNEINQTSKVIDSLLKPTK